MPKDKLDISEEAKKLGSLIGEMRTFESKRSGNATIVLHLLGFSNNSSVPDKNYFEFLIIKATLDCWKSSIFSDLVLMSLGLIRDYEYFRTTLRSRRIAFLRFSNWLQTEARPKEKRNFDDLDSNEQETILKKRLRKDEKNYFDRLCQYILDHKSVLKECIDTCLSDPETRKNFFRRYRTKDDYNKIIYLTVAPMSNFNIDVALNQKSEKEKPTNKDLPNDLYEEIVDDISEYNTILGEPEERPTEESHIDDIPPAPETPSNTEAGNADSELRPQEKVQGEEKTTKPEISKSVSYQQERDDGNPSPTEPWSRRRNSKTENPHAYNFYSDQRQRTIDISQDSYKIINIGEIRVDSDNISANFPTTKTVDDDPYTDYYREALAEAESTFSNSSRIPWGKIGVGIGCVIAITICLLVFRPWHTKNPVTYSVTHIFPTPDEIVLTPDEIRQLEATVLPKEAISEPLTYSSSDTSILRVEGQTGMMTAVDGLNGEQQRTAEIRIQADSGATATKEVTVRAVGDYPNTSNPYIIEQQVRLAGTKTWGYNVEARVGDEIEFQTQYLNTSNEKQEDVMIWAIMPENLEYVDGSTVVYNATHPQGAFITVDNLISDGINIGKYGPGSNGYVRFTARIVDISLEEGSNTLVNWFQGQVNGQVLNDYATVMIYKETE